MLTSAMSSALRPARHRSVKHMALVVLACSAASLAYFSVMLRPHTVADAGEAFWHRARLLMVELEKLNAAADNRPGAGRKLYLMAVDTDANGVDTRTMVPISTANGTAHAGNNSSSGGVAAVHAAEDKYMRLTPGGPIKSFIYHALHKTGSTHVRQTLRAFCLRNKLRCLTYCACDLCKRGRDPVGCAAEVTRRTNKEWNVEFGHLTVHRMRSGCCPAFKNDYEKRGLDAIVEHFPLYVPENWAYVSRWLRIDREAAHDNATAWADNRRRLDAAKVFRFTIVREPVEQFISYYTMLSTAKYQSRDIPPFKQAVDAFYRISTYGYGHNMTRGLDKHRHMHFIMTNSQSKELGWSGDRRDAAGLRFVLDYVRTLDFVGLTGKSLRALHILGSKLNWPKDAYFTAEYRQSRKADIVAFHANSTVAPKPTQAVGKNKKARPPKTVTKIRKSKQKRENLNSDDLRKILAFQWADILLHREAVKIFESY